MRKFIVLCSALLCVLICGAQSQKSDLVLHPNLSKHFTTAEIEQMYQQDFAQLFRLNFKMNNFAMFAAKEPGGNTQDMGFLEKYAKPGVKVDEDEIIRTGRIDPFDYDLPQDEYRINVFQLHRKGFCIFVASKSDYERVVEAQLNQFVY